MTNYKDAKVGLNKVIMNDPEKWLAYRYRGEVLMMDGDMQLNLVQKSKGST